MSLLKNTGGRLSFRVDGFVEMFELPLKEVLGGKVVSRDDFETSVVRGIRSRKSLFDTFGVPDGWVDENEMKKNLKRVNINISVAGVGFISDNKYKKGEYSLILLKLPNAEDILYMVGKAVNFYEGEYGREHVGFSFIQNSTSDDKVISKYVVWRESEIIREEKELKKPSKKERGLSEEEKRRKEAFIKRKRMERKKNGGW